MNLLIFSSANSLFGYIGPGMGGGIIAAIFGIIAAFFLGLWGILYYPIKRALKNKKKKKKLLSKKVNQSRK
jgi:flagellar motor component MotA